MRREINQMSIKFPSRSRNEAFARQAVAAFAAQLDPTIEEMNDIKTAVSEAVTNCIVHAYKERTGYITIQAKLFEGGEIQISVRDKGCGIPDVPRAASWIFPSATGAAASPMSPRRGSRCSQPVTRGVPVWDLPSWRALWTSCAFARAKASARRL